MKKMLEMIDYSKPGAKSKMNDLFYMTMCSVEEHDKELYEHVKTEIHELIYGKKIDEDIAEDWIEDMKPSAKWTKNEVETVANSYGIQIPTCELYVLLNMLYSDSSNIYGDGNSSESIEKYIQGVKDWYYDEDIKISGSEKLYNYYKYIVK